MFKSTDFAFFSASFYILIGLMGCNYQDTELSDQFVSQGMVPTSGFFDSSEYVEDLENLRKKIGGTPKPLAIDKPGNYGLGRIPSKEEIAGWDIDVRPDGLGLPDGAGSVQDGEILYEEKCAICHGVFGEGSGRWPPLTGGSVADLVNDNPEKTIGSYWQFTSTLWDYIRRTMPFTAPQSLTTNEVYSLSAFVLYLNDLVEYEFVLSHENLTLIKLPNENGFFEDPRPDSLNAICMENCKNPDQIKVTWDASHLGVTPEAIDINDKNPRDSELIDERVNLKSKKDATTHIIQEGKQVYESTCFICHQDGIGGAPKLEDRMQWKIRAKKGIQKLVMNAINGFQGETGYMPAKGGHVNLSDREVELAVSYILVKSNTD